MKKPLVVLAALLCGLGFAWVARSGRDAGFERGLSLNGTENLPGISVSNDSLLPRPAATAPGQPAVVSQDLASVLEAIQAGRPFDIPEETSLSEDQLELLVRNLGLFRSEETLPLE